MRRAWDLFVEWGIPIGLLCFGLVGVAQDEATAAFVNGAVGGAGLSFAVTATINRRGAAKQPPPTSAPDPADVTEGYAKALDHMDRINETVAGYRARCEQLGYPSPVCDQMAVTFHWHLTHAAFGGRR